LGSVFNVAAELNPPGTALVDSLTVGIAFPDERPDWVAERFIRVYHHNGTTWESIPLSEITHESVHFTLSRFSPFVIAMMGPITPCGLPVNILPVVFVDSSQESWWRDQETGVEDCTDQFFDRNCGCSWENAYQNLFQILDGDPGNGELSDGQEVWVAKGTYYPTTKKFRNVEAPVTSWHIDPSQESDRRNSFRMKNQSKMYGGFPPKGAPLKFFWNSSKFDPAVDNFPEEKMARAPEIYETILSGDIGEGGGSDNSYTVVSGALTSSLDGFVIQGGQGADDPNALEEERHGAGMDVLTKAFSIKNCTFRSNSTTFGGGGALFLRDVGNPEEFTIENCKFESNAALGRSDFAQTGVGGAIFNVNSSPKIQRSRFHSNTALFDAAAIFSTGSASFPTITSSLFTSNLSAARRGGLSVTEQGG
jgi:hypothetical protein